MASDQTYHPLKDDQIESLCSQGCTAQDWSDVLVADGFDAAMVWNTHFYGEVRIGNLTGSVKDVHGIEKPCGIYDAVIVDCTIGDRTRIANIGVHIANYDISGGVCIEDVATMQTNAGATLGN